MISSRIEWRFILVVLTAVCAVSIANALTPPWAQDPMYEVLIKAEREHAQGASRQTVISNLMVALNTNPTSQLAGFTTNLISDLRMTDQKVKQLSFSEDDIQTHPEKYLSETRFSVLLVLNRHQDLRTLDDLSRFDPKDPVCLLINKGKPSVEKLIDLLADTSVTRTKSDYFINNSMPEFMRVQGVAMRLIEHLTGCDFLLDEYRRSEAYSEILPQVRSWWTRNKNRSREEGIRDQFERAYSKINSIRNPPFGLIWMARNLAESNSPEYRGYGQKVFEEMIRSKRWIKAAETWAEMGSYRPLEILRERASDRTSNPSKILDSSELFFLLDYGGPKEWEIIHDLAQREKAFYGQVPILEQGPNRAGILPVLVEDNRRPRIWLVPTLILALNQTNLVSDAVQSLQRITGKDFGLPSNPSMQQSLLPAQRALTWWEGEGKNQYSFDKLAAIWERMAPPTILKETVVPAQKSISYQIVPNGRYQFEWKIVPSNKSQSGSEAELKATNTDFLIQVTNNEVTCIVSSTPGCVGATGKLYSEGQGTFQFVLSFPAFERLSHRWIIQPDGSFRVEDRDGTTVVKLVK